MRAISILCASLVLLAFPEAWAKPPRLTLVIVVDALGSDLLLRSRPRLAGGLARLMAEGAYYPVARYEYANTVTAPGHATLATGANPWRHGVVANQLTDRTSGKAIPIFADPEHPVLGAPPAGDDASPRSLIGDTLSDRLRLATRGLGKSVAVSVKARAAIAMAGRLGQAWWFSESVGKFITGTSYAKELPRWAKAFNESRLPQACADKRRTPSSPKSGPPSPRPVQSSPCMIDVLVELARAAIEGEQLGKDEVPDLLWVGISSIDFAFHSFGPYSTEIEEAMLKLDQGIGDLLAAAEKAAGGQDHLLVVLSADHGGAALPEEWTRAGLPALRISPTAIHQGLSRELLSRFGADPVVGVRGMDVYLNNQMIEDKHLDGAAVRRAAATWLAGRAEVAAAVARDDLMQDSTAASWSGVLRRGYYPERSGDVLFLLRPFAVLQEAAGGASHGSPYAYDSEVPVIFHGKGVRQGVFRQRISPTDVAPSIASMLEIAGPAQAEGTVRAEAFFAGE